MAMKPPPPRSRRGNRLPDNSFNRRPKIGRPADYHPKVGFEPSPNEGLYEETRLQCAVPACPWDPTHAIRIPHYDDLGQIRRAAPQPVCNHHQKEIRRVAKSLAYNNAWKNGGKIKDGAFHYPDGTQKSFADVEREQAIIDYAITSPSTVDRIPAKAERRAQFAKTLTELPRGHNPILSVLQSADFLVSNMDYRARKEAQEMSKAAQEGIRAALPQEDNPSDSIHNSREPNMPTAQRGARLLKGSNVPLPEATAVDVTGKPYNFRPERREMMSGAYEDYVEKGSDIDPEMATDRPTMKYTPRPETAGGKLVDTPERRKANLEEIKIRRPEEHRDQVLLETLAAVREGRYGTAEEAAGGFTDRDGQSVSIADLRKMENEEFLAYASGRLIDERLRTEKVLERPIRANQGSRYEFPYDGMTAGDSKTPVSGPWYPGVPGEPQPRTSNRRRDNQSRKKTSTKRSKSKKKN